MDRFIDISPTHRIEFPLPSESCYLFRIVNRPQGTSSWAYLTYEAFPVAGTERGILLTDDASLLGQGSAPARTAYNFIANELSSSSNGRVVAAKSLVLDLMRGHRSIPEAAVAVHKYGLVPVACIPTPVTLPVHSGKVSARIAIFPKAFTKSDARPRSNRPRRQSSGLVVRQSLFLCPMHLLTAYLEDVAEDFHDLRRTVSHTDFYRRARVAESRLHDSIEHKLNVMIPGQALSTSTFQVDKEWWAQFIQSAQGLYEVAVAHSFATSLLLELYRMMGVCVSAPRGRVTQPDCHGHFDRLLGQRRCEEIRDQSPVLRFLQRLVTIRKRAAENREHPSMLADELLREATPASCPENRWCGEFAKFAAFVMLLRLIPAGPPTVKLFVSHHHEVPVSTLIRDQIAGLLQSGKPRDAAPVCVDDLPPGAPFRHVIRTLIWGSHGTIAVCPSDTKTIVASHTDKNYKWIARELEHSLLLKKRVFIAIEKGADPERILTDLRDPTIGYLLSGTKLPRPDERAKSLEAEFTTRLQGHFQLSSDKSTADMIDPALSKQIIEFANATREAAAQTMLNGYVNQFEFPVQQTLIRALVCLGPLGSKSAAWIASHIQETFASVNAAASRKAFQDMWDVVECRQLDLGARAVGLISRPKSGVGYRDRVADVLQFLLPGLGSNEAKHLRSQWLKTQMDRLHLVQRHLVPSA